MDKSIFVLIQRDAKNEPFAKVYYNGQDAFHMNEETKIFAGYVTRKSMVGTTFDKDSLVLVSMNDGEILDYDKVDILYDLTYCISGSETGRNNVERLIFHLETGASNLDIQAPLYVGDGVNPPVFLNEHVISKSFKKQDYITQEKKIYEAETAVAKMLKKTK